MSDNLFEAPWSINNPLHLGNIPENPVISEIICQLKIFLRQRTKLSCPNDDIDTRILSAIQNAVHSIQSLMEQDFTPLTDIQKQFSINKCSTFIRDAINVIEKTWKIQSI